MNSEEIQKRRAKRAKEDFDDFCLKNNPWNENCIENDLKKEIEKRYANDKNFNINKCWLTNQIGNSKILHIVPEEGAQEKLFRKLMGLPEDHYSSISTTPYTVIIVSEEIQDAFERRVCSFLPSPSTAKFHLHIWNKVEASLITIQNRTSTTGKKKTVVNKKLLDYHGEELNLPSDWTICGQALSFQAYFAYLENFKRGTLDADDMELNL